MVVSTHLYDALGVAPTATDDEIKRAYKKAALRWHPDRNVGDAAAEAEKKFKEVGEAYEVLSDAKTRRVYDQVGESYKEAGQGMGQGGVPEGFQGFAPGGMGGGKTFVFTSGGGGGGGMPGTHDPRDIFKQFFGAGFNPAEGAYDDEDPLAAMFGGGGMRGAGGLGGLFQAMAGGGGGMPAGVQFQSMGGMGGTPPRGAGMPGTNYSPQPSKPPAKEFPLELTLEELAAGCTKKRKLTRKRMHNNRLVDDSKVVEITVPPGWKAGTKVTFPGEGDESPHHAAGDVVFVVREKPHVRFERQGSDLVYRPRLSRAAAHNVEVELLDGKRVTVRVPAGSGTTGLPEKGMPVRKKGRVVGQGDVLVRPIWG